MSRQRQAIKQGPLGLGIAVSFNDIMCAVTPVCGEMPQGSDFVPNSPVPLNKAWCSPEVNLAID
jgi:hypothetical protein